MDYIEKIERIDRHLETHPKDYQSVISRMKILSKAYEHEMHKRKVYRLKRLAEVKRQLR